jgi:hypothetical protein
LFGSNLNLNHYLKRKLTFLTTHEKHFNYRKRNHGKRHCPCICTQRISGLNVGFIARESWLAKEKEQATKFLRAYQRGVKHTRENRDDGIRALRKYVGLNAAEAAAGYDEYRDSFPMDGRILDAGITATVEQEIEAGRLKGKISLSEMIDGSFINLLGKK